MKKTQLKNIIKESIKELMKEQGGGPSGVPAQITPNVGGNYQTVSCPPGYYFCEGQDCNTGPVSVGYGLQQFQWSSNIGTPTNPSYRLTGYKLLMCTNVPLNTPVELPLTKQPADGIPPTGPVLDVAPVDTIGDYRGEEPNIEI